MGVRVLQRTSIIGLILLVTIAISTYHVFGSHFERKLRNETIDAKLQNIEWVNWKVGLPEKFLQKGDTVLLDFTATWCITCQVNKQLVLERKPVLQAFAKADVALLRADWTRPNDMVADYLLKYKRFGIPFNSLYLPGVAEPMIFSEILLVEKIINLVETRLR